MDEYLDTKGAAKFFTDNFIKCSWHTLVKARSTGSLWGKRAPRFIKIGRAVRYREVDLQEWIDGLTGVGGTE